MFLALNPSQIFVFHMRLFHRAGFGDEANSVSFHWNGGTLAQ
jgi:hypothetical protein